MIRYSLIFILLFAIGFSACEINEPEQVLAPEPALDGVDCEPEIKRFPLEFTLLTGPGAPRYDVKIVTGYYTVEPCKCRVFRYELLVSSASGFNWDLLSTTGSNVPYSIMPGPNADTLVVEELSMFLRDVWIGGSGVLRANNRPRMGQGYANLISAGGLCIVENYGGADPPGAMVNRAIFGQTPNLPPDTGTTTTAYIPLVMTTPY
jgi:hypothetical protein